MANNATSTSGEPVTCRKCGAAVSGKFCSECGTSVDMAAQEGWGAVLEQVAKGDGGTLLATALAIVRDPIGGPVRLALDPTYGGHIKFYLTFVSAAFVLAFVLPQELSRSLLGMDTGGDHSLVKRMMVLQALIVLVGAPALYYLFRWKSGTERSPLSYFKLTLLGIAVSNLLVVVLLGILLAGLVAAAVLFPKYVSSKPSDLQPIFNVLVAIASIASLAYVTLLHKRFWNIHWIWPASIALLFQITIEVVSWPILNALGSGALGSLFK